MPPRHPTGTDTRRASLSMSATAPVIIELKLDLGDRTPAEMESLARRLRRLARCLRRETAAKTRRPPARKAES